METEIALIKQAHDHLVAKIAEVDKNCDERSQVTDAKIDHLTMWLLGLMGSGLLTLVVFVATHAR